MNIIRAEDASCNPAVTVTIKVLAIRKELCLQMIFSSELPNKSSFLDVIASLDLGYEC